MDFQVLLFYKYVDIEDPKTVADRVRGLATKYHLTGRGIIATEGINATLEGKTEDTEKFLEELFTDSRFSDIISKRSAGTGDSFPRLSIKVRDEIVGTRFPQELADPRVSTAPHLPPEKLKEMYDNNEDFVVIDMRNDYEYASGHFRNSIDPGMKSSRDLPLVLPKLEQYKKKKVVTVCTGGVRCEKMSAYLQSNGFEDVSQLDSGIHAYMEKYPGEDFLGTLYTFDKRKVMHFGGEKREVIGTCMRCSAKTETYVNCANLLCHDHFLLCEDCQESKGVFCSDACKEKSLQPV